MLPDGLDSMEPHEIASVANDAAVDEEREVEEATLVFGCVCGDSAREVVGVRLPVLVQLQCAECGRLYEVREGRRDE